MKVIGLYEYNNEKINDILVCENINGYYGELFRDLLNKMNNSTYCYDLVEDNYKLYKFEP